MRSHYGQIAFHGATLIDLCVATAILIALAALSIPTFGSWHIRHQLRSEASAVERTLLDTLQRSTIEHQRYEVVAQERLLTVKDSLGSTVYVQHLANGFKLSPPLPSQILFSPGFTASPSRLILSTRDLSCDITLSLRGQVRTSC